MAGGKRDKTTRGVRSGSVAKKSKSLSTGHRKAIKRAASLILLSGALLAQIPGDFSEYELPFLTVPEQNQQAPAQSLYDESSRAAEEAARSPHEYGRPVHPRDFEVYYDAYLVDVLAVDYSIAVTDCGYCACISCICPSACSSDCGACTTACSCIACSCSSCGGMGDCVCSDCSDCSDCGM